MILALDSYTVLELEEPPDQAHTKVVRGYSDRALRGVIIALSHGQFRDQPFHVRAWLGARLRAARAEMARRERESAEIAAGEPEYLLILDPV